MTNYYNTADASELDDMFKFAARVLQRPALDKNFMLGERSVVTREYDLRVSENPVRKVFSDVNKTLYDGNPLGRSTIGTRESIAALSIAQAITFHKKFYLPEFDSLLRIVVSPDRGAIADACVIEAIDDWQTCN